MDQIDQRPTGDRDNPPIQDDTRTDAGIPAWQKTGAPFASRIAARALSFASRLNQRIRPGLTVQKNPWQPTWKPDDTGLRASRWAEKLVLPIHRVVMSLTSRLERTLSSTGERAPFTWAAPLRGIMGNILARTHQQHPGYRMHKDRPQIPAGYREDEKTAPQPGRFDADASMWTEQHKGSPVQQPTVLSADRLPETPGVPLTYFPRLPTAGGPEEEIPDTMAPTKDKGLDERQFGRESPTITRQFPRRQPPVPAGKAESFSAAVQRRVQPPKLFSREPGQPPSPVPHTGERAEIAPPLWHDTAAPAESHGIPGRPTPVIAGPSEQYSRPEMIQDSDAVIKGPPPVPAEEITKQPQQAKTVEGTGMPVVKYAKPSLADKVPEDLIASLPRPAEPASEGQPAAPGTPLRVMAAPSFIFPHLPLLAGAESRIKPRRGPGGKTDATDADAGFRAAFAMTAEDHPAYRAPSWTQKSMAAFLDRVISRKERETDQGYPHEGRYADASTGWISKDMPNVVPALISDALAGAVKRPGLQEALNLAVTAPVARTVPTAAAGLAMAPLDRPAEDSATVIQRAADTSAPVETSEPGSPEVDIDVLARDVYQIIKRRLVLEKERRAFGY